MKRLLALIPIVMLTGCLTTPVKRNFPDVPPDLMVACPELEAVNQDTSKLSDVLRLLQRTMESIKNVRLKLILGWNGINLKKKFLIV